MRRARTLSIVVALGAALLCPVAMAQPEKPAVSAASGAGPAEADLQAQIAQLRAEIASLRGEIQAMRDEMKKAVTDLAAARANPQAQPQPPKPAQQQDTTVYDVNIGTSPIRGPKDAPVTIVEFADFQCPFCIREWPVVKQVLEQYPNDVRFVFKHYPLPFHAKAKPAHAAAEWALKQKGPEAFWKIHDLIIANPKALETTDLKGYAEQLGLDPAALETLLGDTAKVDELLKADMDDARKYGVRGTPTVLINGLKLADRKVEGYKARIDAILAEKKGIKAEPGVEKKPAEQGVKAESAVEKKPTEQKENPKANR